MGKLTLALKATKELRKQWAKPKKKKRGLSAHQKNIQDVVYDSDFGCKKETVAKLMSALVGVNLVKGEKNEDDKFSTVEGSVLVRRVGENTGNVAADDGRGNELSWVNLEGEPCSMYRTKSDWKPATDKQIKEFYS